MIRSALKYCELGYSVIPIKQGDKKPYVKWERYQTERPTPEQIKIWWKKWPKANVAIVTGEGSDLDVVDCDSKKGRDALNELLPDTLSIPVSKTYRGWHYFFKHSPGLTKGRTALVDCDLQTTRAYVVVPPSIHESGKVYTWLPGLKITDVEPAAMPGMLFDILQNGGQDKQSLDCTAINVLKSSRSRGGDNSEERLQGVTSATKRNKRNIIFTEPGRDESLFHIALSLKKGGMHDSNISECLLFFGLHCNPPFPKKEIQEKIKSAFKRIEKQKGSLTADIREWLSATWGNISVTDALQSVTSATNDDRSKIRVILGRFVKDGLLERVPDRDGVYRKVDNEIEAMDFINTDTDTVDVWLPFRLNEMVEIMPGNIIVVAGSPDSGKTAFLLNVIRQNMRKHEIHYFNSEMGSSELKKRLDKFDDLTLSNWNFKAWERSDNFADVIKPGKGKINIIDFLELHDNFYEVGGKIAAVHKRLDGAIALIALQKNPGVKVGLGGYRSMEKPRLYLSMDSGSITIQKAKNWATSTNPNGLEYLFNLAGGCKFIRKQDWHKPVKT